MELNGNNGVLGKEEGRGRKKSKENLTKSDIKLINII